MERWKIAAAPLPSGPVDFHYHSSPRNMTGYQEYIHIHIYQDVRGDTPCPYREGSESVYSDGTGHWFK